MKISKKLIVLLIVLFKITMYSQNGKVIKIKDGDTIVIIDSLNIQTTIRLAEVDCPESSQPFGKQAKKYTSDEVGLKNVTYEIIGKDRYNRIIAKVFYDGKYLSKEIIKNGYGWHYKQYSTSKELAELERIAKEKKLGLWIDKKPIEPCIYRQNNKILRMGRH